jgi:hypothetical protein
MTFTVIKTDDEVMDRYLKGLLRHGGKDVFPEYLGNCECGNIRSNCKTSSCPSCGKPVALSIDERYASPYNGPGLLR